MDSRDLQIDWLRSFLAIVDSGSVTAAARRVARSQSAVSMQLKKLEDSLGRSLFKRESRGLALTPAGYDLLGHARKLVTAHSTMVDAMHGGTISGRITVGVPDDYAMPYLMPALRSFMDRFGKIEITLVCEDSATLWTKIDRNLIDIALITRDGPARGELLFREALVWVATLQHEAWKRDPIPIAVHGLSEHLRTEILAALSTQQCQFRVAYNSPNVSGQLAAVESGLAIAVITLCSVPSHLQILDSRQGLPGLPYAEIVTTRSKDSKGSRAVDAIYDHFVRALKIPIGT